MSCQPSLERAGELIQLVNHLLRGSAVPLCGLEARRVVCQCRRRSVFLSISSCFFQRRSLSLRSCRLTRVQICFQLSVTHSAGPGSPFWLPSLSLSLCLSNFMSSSSTLPSSPSQSLAQLFLSFTTTSSLSLSLSLARSQGFDQQHMLRQPDSRQEQDILSTTRKYSTIGGCTDSSVRGAHVHDGVCRRVCVCVCFHMRSIHQMCCFGYKTFFSTTRAALLKICERRPRRLSLSPGCWPEMFTRVCVCVCVCSLIIL